MGDSFEKLATLDSRSIQCCITSPPYYGLRDYGVSDQIGQEPYPDMYIGNLLMVMEQVRRVLKDDGTLWLNLGDSYARNGGQRGGGNREFLHMDGVQKRMCRVPRGSGIKAKDLCGIPWRVALALQAAGWYLRQDIIWHKTNPMPESVRDRCTRSHEYLFLLTKSNRYYFNVEAIKEAVTPQKKPRLGKIIGRGGQGYSNARGRDRDNSGGFPNPSGMRQKRSVWSVTSRPFKGAHFATFPPKLIEPCILAGSRVGDTILDPFFGSGTVGLVAKQQERAYIGIEINPQYADMAERRIGAC